MGQQDSIEFIRFILFDISKETNKSDSNYQEFIYTDLSKNLLSKNFHENFLNYENSIITDIYYVQLINIFTCSCGKESFSFQKLLDIPLLIPTNCRNITLKKLIENFFLEIRVNLNDSCLKCHKKKENIKKQIKFDILNEIIIFSLQRIDPVQSIKNTSFIEYYEFIDLKSFIDDKNKINTTTYKLFATIHYNGSFNSGHYYSVINLDNEWVEFNDSNVYPLENIDFNSQNVCVLFYRRNLDNSNILYN